MCMTCGVAWGRRWQSGLVPRLLQSCLPICWEGCLGGLELSRPWRRYVHLSAARPPVLLHTGQPHSLVGASRGPCRVQALVPDCSWFSLVSCLEEKQSSDTQHCGSFMPSLLAACHSGQGPGRWQGSGMWTLGLQSAWASCDVLEHVPSLGTGMSSGQ